MLSAESAAGAYPVEAVTMMDHIACQVESDVLYQSMIDSQRSPPEATTPDAIMAAVHEITQTISAKAIICWTKSGSTALARGARTAPGAHHRADAVSSRRRGGSRWCGGCTA